MLGLSVEQRHEPDILLHHGQSRSEYPVVLTEASLRCMRPTSES
jgi:hypothetical protein